MRQANVVAVTLLAGFLAAGAVHAENDRTAGTVLDDATITASLKTRLIGSPDAKARQIDIETRNGVVILSGFVDSATAKSEAERLARETDGVKSVTNNLEVRADGRTAGTVMDDGGLSAKVNAALAADARTSAMDIDVAVREGDVQLSGFVASANEKTAATEVARGVDGVRTVTNSLTVR